MEADQPALPAPGIAAGRRRRTLAAMVVLTLIATPVLAWRQLAWRPLAVEARLDADGVLWVRESHTMVFTGDWNGGERIFRLAADQSLELLSMTRVDRESGEEVPLAAGGLARVDQYDWADRKTLRWRSRLPGDPPFDNTTITYVIEYRQERVLQPAGGRYLLRHDFAFPDRQWPIDGFTLELELDPIWQPLEPVAKSHGPLELGRLDSYVVDAELEYTGAGSPAGVRALPPVGLRAVPFIGAVLAILALVIRFRDREAALGRFDPPPVPAQIDTVWLEEHLFALLPEEAGALWDRKVGPPEVAAILARWQAEGKIASAVVPKAGRFKRDVLELKLNAERDGFEGYEAKLLGKLFFDGREETDTEAIRKHYASRGFDPAATVRPGIERQLERLGREFVPHKRLPGSGRRLTLALFLAFVALMVVEAFGRPLLTLQLAIMLMVPVSCLYLLPGLIFAHVFRGRFTRLGPWSLGFVLPGMIFFAQTVVVAFFDRLLPGVDFAPQPGIAGVIALAVLAVMVWSSLFNNASSRERAGGLRRRQEMAVARGLLASELKRQRPVLDDGWMPYLLALGLGPRVDLWWRRFGGVAQADATSAAGRFVSGTSGTAGGGWTGGGGAFGGAGATVSWAAVAGSVAAGVARPGSGGSGGSGGGGGSSSGGGGGGGW